MDKPTLRVISKAGFLIIIAGFLMPILNNYNGFQLTDYLSVFFSENNEIFLKFIDKDNVNFNEKDAENFSVFKNGKNVSGISLYSLFFISCTGVILFILLLFKKLKFSIIIDWAIITASIIAMLGIFSGVSNVLRYLPNGFEIFGISGVGKKIGSISGVLFPLLKPGTFLLIIGLLISIIFNLIASFRYEKNGKIKYDFKTIIILFLVIFSIIFGCSLAIITG